MIGLDISVELLDPDAPVHQPPGMTRADCLAHRAKLRELLRQDGLAELNARRAGRYLTPTQLAAEARDQRRIDAAEDRREGRDSPR